MTEGRKILHFLMRFSDTLKQVDTFKEHQKVAIKRGSVWWGKFGAGMARSFRDIAKQQIADGVTTYVYLSTGGKVRYRARLLDVLAGGRVAPRPEEEDLIPRYYREGMDCGVWFRLEDLREIDSYEARKLMLWNTPYLRASALGMRGLVYLTPPTKGVEARERPPRPELR